MNTFRQYLFYGNYFYGICAVALSIEASVQQFVPLNSLAYYTAIFAASVVFYTKAYLPAKPGDKSENVRTEWYNQHHFFSAISQLILSMLLLVCCFFIGKNLQHSFQFLHWQGWFILLLFPLAGVCYYGLFNLINLRDNGVTKPFLIGLVWAGLVTAYPLLFNSIEHQLALNLTIRFFVLFLKNWMFIAVLCIMFDIKDYAVDANQSLQTFVVQKGLRKTIFNIILPLSVLGLIIFIVYAANNHFPIGRILINTIPFILLMVVAFQLKTRRSILYYLSVVDGLMLLKSICGIVAIWLFP